MDEIKPGDKVTSSLHPSNGVGVCTYISYEKDNAFVCWGVHEDQSSRKPADKMAICKPSQLTKYGTDNI